MADKVLKLFPGTELGTVRIGKKELVCAVLEDGRRVLSQDEFLRAIGRSGRPKGGTGSASFEEVNDLPPFLSTDSLKSVITKVLRDSTKPIPFRRPGGQKAYGYEATLLPQVCEVYLLARDANPPILHYTQMHIVKACDLLMLGLAHVGISALVDDATKYTLFRDREALQKILDAYISKGLEKWAKRFPDEFYQEMFRLQGWQYAPLSVKRPIRVAQLTNDLVYSRLPPGVLDELRRITPKDEKGRRRHHYHRHLTADLGHEVLRDHLSGVIFLMKAAPNWTTFYRAIQRAAPQFNKTP